MVKSNIYVVEHLKSSHSEVLQKTEELYSILNNLQYEGKIYYRRNLRSMSRIFKYFSDDFIPHLRWDEKTLFPFVSSHVPKLDPIIQFLRGEHNEIRNTLKDLKSTFKKLSEEKDTDKAQVLKDALIKKGTYLYCLLRNHIQTEDEGVYKRLEIELRKEEILRLQKQCSSLQ